MSRNHHIEQAQLEALIDGELGPEECALIETHLASCQCCQDAFHQIKCEQAAWSAAWQGRIDAASEAINWDGFEANLMAQIEQEELYTDVAHTDQPIVPAMAMPATLSWQERLFGWIKAHPGLLIASAATAGILLLFALPALDPGPSEKDVDIVSVIKSKTAKVSVLNSTNQATGRAMTVIVVKEPPTEHNAKRSPKAPPHKAHPSPSKQP